MDTEYNKKLALLINALARETGLPLDQHLVDVVNQALIESGMNQVEVVPPKPEPNMYMRFCEHRKAELQALGQYQFKTILSEWQAMSKEEKLKWRFLQKSPF